MTCQHCAELQARVRYLENLSRKERGVRVVAELAMRLRLADQPARVLAALYQARGRALSREFLQEEIMPPRGHADFSSDKHLDVVICKIRRVAGFGAVLTHPGLGYSITDLGRLVCEEALERRAVAA